MSEIRIVHGVNPDEIRVHIDANTIWFLRGLEQAADLSNALNEFLSEHEPWPAAPPAEG